MRDSKQCPKCKSLKIGHLPRQPDFGDGHLQDRVAGAAIVEEGGQRRAYMLGKVEAYVCTECGYHETYVVDPKQVNWEAMKFFRWVNPASGDKGPYR
jgi:hypothetical protein